MICGTAKRLHQRSPYRYNNYEKFEYCDSYKNVSHRQEMNKYYWKNSIGTDRLAQHWFAISVQSVKRIVSVKCSMMCVCNIHSSKVPLSIKY